MHHPKYWKYHPKYQIHHPYPIISLSIRELLTFYNLVTYRTHLHVCCIWTSVFIVWNDISAIWDGVFDIWNCVFDI